jgi:hypothetical protein
MGKLYAACAANPLFYLRVRTGLYRCKTLVKPLEEGIDRSCLGQNIATIGNGVRRGKLIAKICERFATKRTTVEDKLNQIAAIDEGPRGINWQHSNAASGNGRV